jgi:hypothetical protein
MEIILKKEKIKQNKAKSFHEKIHRIKKTLSIITKAKIQCIKIH